MLPIDKEYIGWVRCIELLEEEIIKLQEEIKQLKNPKIEFFNYTCSKCGKSLMGHCNCR